MNESNNNERSGFMYLLKQSTLPKTAMMIVNQLYDLAEVPVEKRQKINDIATNYVELILKDLTK